jgi:hypothetical protein
MNAPTSTAPHINSTKLRKASRSATEEEIFENCSSHLLPLVFGYQQFVARICCGKQHFYWGERLIFRNKRGN